MENNNLKILLINPPSEFKTPVLPLGLASIAGYLRNENENLNISVIDAWAEGLSFYELKNRISQSQADIIGIYIVSPRYNKGKSTIEICRQIQPGSIIIAGGPHPSSVPAETLNEIAELDICVIGEGEITMNELIRAFQDKSPLSAINGIAYRNKESKEVIITKPRDFIKDIDTLPLPARDLFPLDKYKTHPPYGRKNPYFSIMTSRGCPFQCAYCSKDVFKDFYRARSPEKICDEIEELIIKYHAQEIHFYDDDFTINMERGEKICDEILRRNIKIRWSCLTRVDLVSEQLLRKMKQAGCWLIAYGVESGSQKVLNNIGKGFTIEQVISAFGMTRKIGLSTICYIMAGLPGETKETIKETINLVKKIKPNFISYGILIVYPGSRLFKLIQTGKYQGKLRTLTEKENLAGLYFGIGKYSVLEDNLTFEELRKIVQKTTRQFYLRPQYIIQAITNIRSLADFKYLFNGGMEIIRSLIK